MASIPARVEAQDMSAETFPGSEVRHGTYSGYVTHAQRRETPCEPCRDACRAYRARPDQREKIRVRAAAQKAALHALRRRHAAEYRRLYRQECAARGLTLRSPR